MMPDYAILIIIFSVLFPIILIFFLIKKENERSEKLKQKAIQMGLYYKKKTSLKQENVDFLDISNSIYNYQLRNFIYGTKRDYEIKIFEYSKPTGYNNAASYTNQTLFIFKPVEENITYNFSIEKKNFFNQGFSKKTVLKNYPNFEQKYVLKSDNDKIIDTLNPELLRFYENLNDDKINTVLKNVNVVQNNIIFTLPTNLKPEDLSNTLERIFKVLYLLKKND